MKTKTIASLALAAALGLGACSSGAPEVSEAKSSDTPSASEFDQDYSPAGSGHSGVIDDALGEAAFNYGWDSLDYSGRATICEMLEIDRDLVVEMFVQVMEDYEGPALWTRSEAEALIVQACA